MSCRRLSNPVPRKIRLNMKVWLIGMIRSGSGMNNLFALVTSIVDIFEKLKLPFTFRFISPADRGRDPKNRVSCSWQSSQAKGETPCESIQISYAPHFRKSRRAQMSRKKDLQGFNPEAAYAGNSSRNRKENTKKMELIRFSFSLNIFPGAQEWFSSLRFRSRRRKSKRELDQSRYRVFNHFISLIRFSLIKALTIAPALLQCASGCPVDLRWSAWLAGLIFLFE